MSRAALATAAASQPHFQSRWTSGNAFELLENGEAYYPAVFDAIRSAEREVVIETFILFDDKVGQELHAALLAAAGRGVAIDLTIDGFGSPDLPDEFTGALLAAGVKLHVFDPAPRIAGWRTNWLRRMHRKIVVVDGRIAFVGGINFSADHLGDFGPEAKQDYAVSVRGPLVAEVRDYVRAAIAPGRRSRPRWFGRRQVQADAAPGQAMALLAVRDNHQHRTDIERHYRAAIRSAKERVVIANAYFFPGYRLLRDIRHAARRGVKVALILQGQPDMPIVKVAARMLYHHLVSAGVELYEYCQRPLHGKVALIDGEWSTVGSSNLDPLSLSLNLEANVVIRDRAFNATLAERLGHLMDHCCQRVEARELGPLSTWGLVRSHVVYHLVRWYPRMAYWFPEHRPTLETLAPAADHEVLAHRGSGA